jgi:hypothetical protein
MLDGELAYHKGNYEEAFASPRTAVERDDDLEYVEPRALEKAGKMLQLWLSCRSSRGGHAPNRQLV